MEGALTAPQESRETATSTSSADVLPEATQKTSDSATVSCAPALRTFARQTSRSPFAARSRLILNSAERTYVGAKTGPGCERHVGQLGRF